MSGAAAICASFGVPLADITPAAIRRIGDNDDGSAAAGQSYMRLPRPYLGMKVRRKAAIVISCICSHMAAMIRKIDPLKPRLAGCTCIRLRKASRRVSQICDRSLEAAGMTVTQYGLLAYLAKFGSASISGLAEKLIEADHGTDDLDPISLVKVKKENWSFGNGEAQFMR